MGADGTEQEQEAGDRTGATAASARASASASTSASSAAAPWTGLLLHGHGDEPASVAPIAATLQRELGFPWICPAAPHALAGGGAAWWPDEREGPDDVTIRSLLAAAGTGPAPLRPLVIAGFSQGAATALAAAARLTAPGAGGGGGPRPLRIVAVAGFLAGDGAVPAGADVLVVHGTADEVVDPFHGGLVARRCRRNGCDVTEVAHDGGHVWDDAVTAEVLRWSRGGRR